MKKIIRGLDNLLYEIDTETSINLIRYMETNEKRYCGNSPIFNPSKFVDINISKNKKIAYKYYHDDNFIKILTEKELIDILIEKNASIDIFIKAGLIVYEA